jgi:hypothetical protein
MRPLSDHRLRHISNVEKWADESVVASDLSALEVEIQVFRVGRYLGLEQLQGYALIHVGNVLAKEKPDLPTFAKAVAVAFVPCPLTDGTELQPLLASYAAINYDIWVRQPGDTLPNLMSLGSFGYHCTRAQQCYAPEKLKLPAPKDTEVVPNLTDQHAQERLEKPPSNGGGNTLSGVEGHADNTSSSVFKTPANGVKGHSGSPMDTSPGHTSQPAGGPRMHHGKASRSNIKPKAKPLLSATPLLDLEYLFRVSLSMTSLNRVTPQHLGQTVLLLSSSHRHKYQPRPIHHFRIPSTVSRARNLSQTCSPSTHPPRLPQTYHDRSRKQQARRGGKMSLAVVLVAQHRVAVALSRVNVQRSACGTNMIRTMRLPTTAKATML